MGHVILCGGIHVKSLKEIGHVTVTVHTKKGNYNCKGGTEMNRQEIKDMLKQNGIAFQEVEHPAVFTIEEMEKLNLPDMWERQLPRICFCGMTRRETITW